MIYFPPFRLDLEQGRLWKGEALLSLRRKPFAILCYLVAHPKKLITQQELLAQVWGGAVVSDSSMRSHLHELRQVLGEGVIETVIGRGYRFVATLGEEPVTRSPEPTPAVAPPVVGRGEQLAVLRAAFDRACAGHRQFCFVTGPPGIGKTTLVRTFVTGLPNSPTVGTGTCFEQHGTPEPYFAVIEALTAVTRSARGAEAVSALVRFAPTFVAQLPSLVAEEQLAEATRRAAGGNESRHLRELCEVFEALSAKQPLVLVLEDLQWSDLASIDLLSLLGQRQEHAKLLVIGTSRHAEVQDPDHPLNRVMRSLVARSRAVSVQVPEVDMGAVQKFIDLRFPGHAFPDQFTRSILNITGGTPLFMVSLLDEFAARGMLAERESRWSLTLPLEDVLAHRPASVKQLIDMQLDRLSPVEQQVLEASSIVGLQFSTTLVAAALGLSVDEVDDICDALARRHLFLREESVGAYGVTHALVQEVCVERSSASRRKRWHRRIAEAIERGPSAPDHSHLLAKHFDAADDPERAAPAYLAAARQATQRYARADTLTLCTRALEVLSRLPTGNARDRLEFEITQLMCRQLDSNSFSTTFVGRDPLVLYTRASELARKLDEPSSLYAALTELTHYNLLVSRYAQSAELFAELDRIAQAHELDPTLVAAATFAQAYTALFSGEPRRALELLERLASREPGEPRASDLTAKITALAHLACARWVVGDPDQALADACEAMELAKQTELRVLPALAHSVRARLRYLRRDPVTVLEGEVEVALAATSVDVGLNTEAKAVALWARALRAPLPLSEIEPVLGALRQRVTDVSTGSTLVGLVLIDVLRASTHVAEAKQLGDEIIEFARGHGERVYLPELLRQRGELMAAEDPEAAEQSLLEAIEVARSMGSNVQTERAMQALERVASPSTRPRRSRRPARP